MSESESSSKNEISEIIKGKEEKIQMILRQTNYTITEAEEKLIIFKEDPILVIKDFLGIKDKIVKPISSLNQEIYRQLRYKLNTNTNLQK
jgi:hypothetical protein